MSGHIQWPSLHYSWAVCWPALCSPQWGWTRGKQKVEYNHAELVRGHRFTHALITFYEIDWVTPECWVAWLQLYTSALRCFGKSQRMYTNYKTLYCILQLVFFYTRWTTLCATICKHCDTYSAEVTRFHFITCVWNSDSLTQKNTQAVNRRSVQLSL